MINFMIGIGGVLIGIVIGLLIASSKTIIGSLIVDETDENTDVYRIEIDNLDAIPKKKRMLLKIVNSHK